MAVANRLMPWNFEVADTRNFTAPVMQGIEAGYRDRQQGIENQRSNRLLDLQVAQGDLAQQKFDMDRKRFQRELDRAKVLDPLEEQRIRAGIEQTRQSTAADAAKLQQMRMETPEARAQIAQRFGLQPGTPEYTAYVLNRQYAPPDPIKDLIRSAIPQAAPSAPPAQPPASMRPMSDQSAAPDQPQIVQAQAAQPAAPVPQQQSEPMVDTPIGRMPESRAKMLGFALAMQGKGDAGKMLAGEPGLGRTAVNDIDEKIVKSVDLLARLDSMAQTFQDRYQTMGTRLGMVGTSWLAKIDPSRISPEQSKELADFARDRRRGIENVNTTIKDITGAAMSIPEAQRITQQVPNPGTGIFDGDDPITYRAKLNDVIDQTRLALARYAWLKRNNTQLLNQLASRKMEGVESIMPLDRMRDVMNERKNQIFQELRQRSPNASPQQLLPFVGQQLKQEFGI